MGVHVRLDIEFDSDVQDEENVEIWCYRNDGEETQHFVAREGLNTYYLRDITEDPESSYKFRIYVQGPFYYTPTVKRAEVILNQHVSPKDTERVAGEVEWSHYAEDNNESFVVLEEYEVELINVDGTSRRFNPTSVSYTPKINMAKDLSLECEPFEWLEGTDWLGANIRVWAGDDFIYEGEVKAIDTNQPHDDYGITTRSHGKKLLGDSVDLGTRNQIATDAIAELVDKSGIVYTEWAQEQGSLSGTNIDTSNEEISVADSSNGPGTAIIEDVGRSAHKSYIYVKAYNPDGLTVTVDSKFESISETLDLYDDNEFGRWYTIQPESLPDSWYDVELELTGNTVVRDFRMVENPTLVRDIQPTSLTGGGTNEEFYSYDIADMLPGVETHNVTETYSGYRARQKAAYHVVRSGDTGASSADSSAVYDAAYITTDGTTQPLDKLQRADRFPYWDIHARVALEQDNGAGTASFDLDINGISESYTLDTSDMSGTYDWLKIASHSDNDGWGATMTKNDDITWDGINTGDGVGFDMFVVVVGDQADFDFTYEFSSSLNDNGMIERPMKFAEGYVTLEEKQTPGDMTEASVQTNIVYDDEGHAPYGPVHTNVPGDYEMDPPNSQSISTPFDGGTTHTTRVYMGPAGTRQNCSPALGYKAQHFWSIDVTGSYNELQRIYDMDLQGNVLDLMNSIASDTNVTFRFEGDTVKIFEDEVIIDDTEFISETIESTASIEEVYESCEVHGDGVTSGVIMAEDAPEFVDDHKQIHDMEITTKRDAIRRAKGFLEDNGTIKYQGSIDTLPTFAPLGEMIPGEYFNHGQAMQIRSVNYGRRNAVIKLGWEKSISNELIEMRRQSGKSTERLTR